MPLIDWYTLGANALWVLALALALLIVSYAAWEASARSTRWRTLLGAPRYQAALNACGALFCLGMGLTAARWWEQALWGLTTAGFVWTCVRAWRKRHET